VKTSKSPRRVLQVAHDAACKALPAHRHKFSPKKFTQPQLLACLVLKEFSRLDYRGLAAHLADHPDLGTQIGMKVVPHFTTFQKAAQRLLAATPGRRMFDAVLERALEDRVRKRRVRLAAIDGTGLESRHVSRYFTKRQADGKSGGDRTYAHFPKAVFVADCASHMILAAVPGRGPATDLVQFGRAFSQAARRARIDVLLADADFDAEWLHRAVRSHGVRTIIPPTRGRPSDKPPAGRWRRVMKQRFARLKRAYGQRWQVETVNSMIKRRLGSALRARVEANQFREIVLRAITHNVMIVRLQVFYRARGEGIMAISLPDARLLSDDVLQALRLRALRGCELGFTEADVANLLGVSRETVSRRWSAYSSQGLDAAAGAVRTPPRLRAPVVRPASQPHPRAPRQPQPRRPGHPCPPVEPPRRARPDPQGVRRRPGRADRGRVPQPLGLYREETAPPRP
jgi:hypothetical protein